MVRRTKQDALATRAALLDAAEHVFGERGVSRTSLADIARAAGVTRGAVYWHFKDKVDLFNAMMERVTLPLESELAGAAEAPGDPIDTLMTRLGRSLEQIATDERTQRVLSIATLMVEHVGDLWPVRERHTRMGRTNAERVARVFERASVLRGQPLPAPPMVLAEGFHALVNGLVQGWLLEARRFDLLAVAGVATPAYLRGIGLPPHDALEPSMPQPPSRSGIISVSPEQRL